MIAETEVLHRCPFFERFQPKHLEKIANLGIPMRVARDQFIFREDDCSTQFYVILSGRVAVEASSAGSTTRIQTLYSGDELGWSAMLGRPKQFQARALDDCEVLSFEASKLLEACDSNPYFARAFLERLLAVVAERLQLTRLQLAAASAPEGPMRNA